MNVPTIPFHRAVLSAWIRRNLWLINIGRNDPTVTAGYCYRPPVDNPEYHPAKAHKIYLRWQKIIDLYA